MYKTMFKVEGTGLTVKELKEAFAKEYDEYTTNLMFEDKDENEQATDAFAGWIQEEGGCTMMLEEVF